MILQTYEKRQKQPTLYFNEFLDRIKFFHVSIVNHVSSHVCSSGENVHRVLDIPLSDRWIYFKMLGMFTNFYCNTFEGFGLFTSSVNNRKFYFLSSVYSFFIVSQIHWRNILPSWWKNTCRFYLITRLTFARDFQLKNCCFFISLSKTSRGRES